MWLADHQEARKHIDVCEEPLGMAKIDYLFDPSIL